MRPKIITISETSPSSDAANVPSVGYWGGLSYFDALTINAILAGATDGTLDVYLQTSYDMTPGVAADDPSRIWYDYAHWQQIPASTAPYQVVWHVNRSTAITAETVSGQLLNPALGPSTILGGAWGDMMRILFVPGTGTTAGASQTITIIAQCVKP